MDQGYVPQSASSKIVDLDIYFSDQSDRSNRKDRCFYENFGGLADLTIYDNQKLEQLKTQAREVVKFATKFYYLMQGNMNDPLAPQDFRICTSNQMGRLLEFDTLKPKTLHIGIPFIHKIGRTDHYTPLYLEDLLKYWKNGLQYVDVKSKFIADGNSIIAKIIQNIAKSSTKAKVKS